MKGPPIYRTNTGSICAIGSVEKDVDPVPNNRAPILGGNGGCSPARVGCWKLRGAVGLVLC